VPRICRSTRSTAPSTSTDVNEYLRDVAGAAVTTRSRAGAIDTIDTYQDGTLGEQWKTARSIGRLGRADCAVLGVLDTQTGRSHGYQTERMGKPESGHAPIGVRPNG
jgi:hypothetical protein